MNATAWRRRIHQWPEPGFVEYRTAAAIADGLLDLGYDVTVGTAALDADARLGVPEDTETDWLAAGAHAPQHLLDPMRGGLTAVVARLDGDAPGPTTAYRFDIDALPIDEATDEHMPSTYGFRSARSGFMHACGHDGHVGIGMELASRLASRHFPGSVRLLFQPAEEGLRGGKAMATSANLDEVDVIYAIHLGMGRPTGEVFGGTWGALASTKLRATYRGTPAHPGLDPQNGRSALLAAASAALAVHTLSQHGATETRINVGSLEAPGAPNVVPGFASMELDVRAGSSAACQELTRRVMHALAAAGRMYEVEARVEVIGEAPAVVCDEQLADHVVRLASTLPDVDVAQRLTRDGASDDAAWLLDGVRARGGYGTYIVIGADQPSGHHSPRFDFDERALQIAADTLELLALQPPHL